MENTQNMLLLDNDSIVREGVSVFEVTDMPASFAFRPSISAAS